MEIRHLAPTPLIQRAPWSDIDEVRVGNWMQPWDGAEEIDVGLIGVPYSRASIIPTSADAGPNAVRSTLAYFTTYSIDYDVEISGLKMRDMGDVQTSMVEVERGLIDIEEAFTDLFRAQSFMPVAIGGDHSITWPIVKAVHNSRPDAKIGVVQFDGHHDLRVMAHGPTHGTPMRRILESDIGVQGRNLVQIGLHGFGNPRVYFDYAKKQGIRVITAREVRRQGIERVMAEAIEQAGDGTDLIYVSLDIDALAAVYGPGTGVVKPEGMDPYELLEAMYLLGREPAVWGLDIAELDPTRDIAGITTKTVCSAILTFLGGFVHRD